MKYFFEYNKTKTYKYLTLNSKDDYKGIGKNDLFIREKKNKLIIKIRTKNKYPFQRIESVKLCENIWFSKYPNSNELLVLYKLNNHIEICVYVNLWKYRFNILYPFFDKYNKIN